MSILTNRYEILFLYECRDCNPNGDPLDENRPRTDPDTGEATVTDVRIKRTVRDYFLGLEPDVDKRMATGMEILVRDTLKSDGYLAEGKDRADYFLESTAKGKKGDAKRKAIQGAILSHCIDARLFGAALPLGQKEPSIQLTGPVQFSAFNRSLHRVTPVMVQQTAAYAGSSSANQKSFAERWLLPYGLISAYGVVNETAAQTTGMTEADLDQLLKALWRGTANLNTHSKIGHDPLLLVVAEYAAGHRIGALNRRVSMSHKLVEDTALRSTEHFQLDVTELLRSFKNCKTLKAIRFAHDPRLRCVSADQEALFAELAGGAGLSLAAMEL